MTSIVISPKTEEEYSLMMNILKRMRIKATILSDEEKEDIGLLEMMKEVDMSDTVDEKEAKEALGLY